VSWAPYSESSRGQKVRGWLRFAHTGELFGVTGQTIAGLASLGGAVLVWDRPVAGVAPAARLARLEIGGCAAPPGAGGLSSSDSRQNCREQMRLRSLRSPRLTWPLVKRTC
jgi:hypothetical protein